MPRIRTLKPEIASDVKLASVSIEARYTFVLMITQADDIGLIAGAHRQLLGALYPLDETVSVDRLGKWVTELVGAGLLLWHATRDGAPVIQIVNWARHQRVDNAGRSQVGALIADPPPELAAAIAQAEAHGKQQRSDARGGSRRNSYGPSGTRRSVKSSKPRGDSPQLAATNGGSPLVPPSTEHRPPTTDQRPPSSEEAVVSGARTSMTADGGAIPHDAHVNRQPAEAGLVASHDPTVPEPMSAGDKRDPFVAATGGEALLASRLPSDAGRKALSQVLDLARSRVGVVSELAAMLDGMHPPKVEPVELEAALSDYVANGQSNGTFNARHFRRYVLQIIAEPAPASTKTRAPNSARNGKRQSGMPQQFDYSNATAKPEDIKWQS